MDNNSELEEAIFNVLEAGHQLSINWDCGGDEVVLSIFFNQQSIIFDKK